jgi:hypothetical protein
MSFSDPIAPKVKKNKQKTSWDYRAPAYDERSSCYVDAGTHYGIGYNNPVGHMGKVKMRVSTMPFGRPQTMEVDEAPRRQLPQENLE